MMGDLDVVNFFRDLREQRAHNGNPCFVVYNSQHRGPSHQAKTAVPEMTGCTVGDAIERLVNEASKVSPRALIPRPATDYCVPTGMGFKRVEKFWKLFGGVLKIVVHSRDQFAAGMVKSAHGSERLTVIIEEVYGAKLRVLFDQCNKHWPGIVGGGVIDDDDFVVDIARLQNSVQPS
jgi:hypothetical protein